MRTILRNILIATSALAATACSGELRSGDLVFVSETGGAMDEAIVAATGVVTHVGIVKVDGDSTYVIDATPKHGVAQRPLRDLEDEGGQLSVRRIKGVGRKEAADFVRRAETFIGEPYDFTFLPDNGAHYCSELVYDVCILGDRHIFEAVPMNFLAQDGSLPEYWKTLFESLGMEVPQGVPGTNPEAMSHSPALK